MQQPKRVASYTALMSLLVAIKVPIRLHRLQLFEASATTKLCQKVWADSTLSHRLPFCSSILVIRELGELGQILNKSW